MTKMTRMRARTKSKLWLLVFCFIIAKTKAAAPFGAVAFLYVENASGAERNRVGAGLRV